MNPNVSAMKRLKAYCDALNIEFSNLEKAWLDKTTEEGKKILIPNQNNNTTLGIQLGIKYILIMPQTKIS